MTRVTGRSKKVTEWLEVMGVDVKNTRRVIIDIPYDGAVIVYLEQLGNLAMFEISPPPDLDINPVTPADTPPQIVINSTPVDKELAEKAQAIIDKYEKG